MYPFYWKLDLNNLTWLNLLCASNNNKEIHSPWLTIVSPDNNTAAKKNKIFSQAFCKTNKVEEIAKVYLNSQNQFKLQIYRT